MMMPLRYLVGPVTPQRASEWDQQRQQGYCLSFNPDSTADVQLGHADTWETVLSRLPADWRPDFLLLDLGYTTVPAWLWDAPVPLIALAPDWQLQWHFLRRFLPHCQLVLTDQAGVSTMHRQGITHAIAANLYGLQGIFRVPSGSPSPLRGGVWGEGFFPSRRRIDILFVGNLHPAVQRERLTWLGRLARLQGKWRVHIAQGVLGEEYRQLLLRSRIVFNRAIRGEWNLRVGEACSCGALLFCEAGNLEMPAAWKHGQDCIFYDEDNLETLLNHYLDHEDERQAIAESGRRKVFVYSFSSIWDDTLARIEQHWPDIQQRHAQRPGLDASATLLTRTWQALGAADHGDPVLARDLDASLALAWNPALENARGLVSALAVRHARGGISAEQIRPIGQHFHQAATKGPARNPLASLNLMETLVMLDQKPLALQGARPLLAQLLDSPLRASDLDEPHFPPGYDFFRVEWERAAWQHAGSPAAEARAKLVLLRWRLHTLAATLSAELPDYHEAVLARPDLPPSRAALGCALARARRFVDAIEHLHIAVTADPFDRAAARALYQTLIDSNKTHQGEALKQERLLLHLAAPTVVPAEDWFTQTLRQNLLPLPASRGRRPPLSSTTKAPSSRSTRWAWSTAPCARVS
jgi:hypothetical protein